MSVSIPVLKREHDVFVLLLDARVAMALTPKVASTAIAECLSRHYGAILARPHHACSAFRWFTLSQVKRFTPSYRRAMFVRNPYDRLVSTYEYHIVATKLQMSRNMVRSGFTADMSFEEFCGLVARDVEADAHFALQSWQSDRVDFVGRFETLETDWKRFRDWLGIDIPDLTVENYTPRAAYRSYYSEALRERVGRLYQPDLDAFGYAF